MAPPRWLLPILLIAAAALFLTASATAPVPAAGLDAAASDDDLSRRLGAAARRRRHRWKGAGTAAAALERNASTALDARCHAREHTGYAGDGAVVWGMSFKLADAGECCAACKAHAATCAQPGSKGKSWWPARPDLKCGGANVCQIWTFCPEERCFAFDVHKHAFGECWLKFQKEGLPHAPKDPHVGHQTYPEIMRHAPRKIWPWPVKEEIWSGPMPYYVPWISGVLAEPSARIASATPNDKWREKWCRRHGPC